MTVFWITFLEWFASISALVAVAQTQLAGHKHCLASEYYARQDYLKHSARMRRLIQQQRTA